MQSTNGNSEQVQRKALTEEQINSFWTNGYLKVGKILEDDEIELLRREYDGNSNVRATVTIPGSEAMKSGKPGFSRSCRCANSTSIFAACCITIAFWT